MTTPLTGRVRLLARVNGREQVYLDGRWLDAPEGAYRLLGHDIAGYADGDRIVRLWEQLRVPGVA